MAPPGERGFLWKLRRLKPGEIAALAEALVLVTIAAPAVKRLSFRRLGRIASWPIARPLPAGARRDELLDRVAWAIWAAAKRSRLRALCFETGLAAQIMLRRRGIDSTLFYGVRPGSTARLDAHVWVKAGDYEVTGYGVGHYPVLTTFPAQAERAR